MEAEQLILETIDPHTLAPTDGEGDLVVTNIVSPVMPMIRYRTGETVAHRESGDQSPHSKVRWLVRWQGGG